MSAIAHAINADRFPSLAGMGAIAVDVETHDHLLVPLKVDAGTGPNWGTCE